MNFKRVLINFLLVLSLILAIFVAGKAYFEDKNEILSAALSVIAAVLASWASYRNIWVLEEQNEPNLVLNIDLVSRSQLTQISIENLGGGIAYEVEIVWKKPLKRPSGIEFHYLSGKQNIDLLQINKGQKISNLVGKTEDIFSFYKSENTIAEFHGLLRYYKSKSSWWKTEKEFFLSLENLRSSLNHESELQRFLFEGATFFKEMNSIKKEK